MKAMILIAFVLVSSALTAQAAGREEASKICSSMSFESSRNQCLEKLRPFEYFDTGAIEVCKTMGFDSTMVQCVSAIGDKAYENYEIENCLAQDFDSTKLSCLNNNGKRYTRPQQQNCISKGRLVQKLKDVEYLVYNGQNRSAGFELRDLINTLEYCQ